LGTRNVKSFAASDVKITTAVTTTQTGVHDEASEISAGFAHVTDDAADYAMVLLLAVLATFLLGLLLGLLAFLTSFLFSSRLPLFTALRFGL
jgi:hypothetical protein